MMTTLWILYIRWRPSGLTWSVGMDLYLWGLPISWAITPHHRTIRVLCFYLDGFGHKI